MKDGKSVYLLLTLTVRSCSAKEVEQTKALLNSGLREMVQIESIRCSLFFRYCFLETVYHPSVPLDVQYHPHLHCIVELRGKRPSCKVIQECWRQACGLDYDPILDVRKLPDFDILHSYPPAG